MTFYSRWTLPAAMACGLLAACGSSGGNTNPTPDGSTDDTPVTGDSMVTPDGGMDATGDATGDRPADRTDSTADRADTARPDVTMMSSACASPEMVSGMPAMDGAIHIMGNNESGAPEQVGNLGLAAMGGCLGAIMGEGAKGAVVVYRYTMRAAGTLTASTANPGTSDDAFDTVVAILPTCTANAMPLACNDDLGMAGGMLHQYHSTARTATPLMMGQTVFIVVGGWGTTTDGASTGDYELTIREAPVVPVGMPCTAADTCAADSACVIPTGMMRGTCTADGALGARCRLPMGMACDMGLACSVATPTAMARGVCRRTLMVGEECGGVGVVCPMASACRAAPNAMNPARTACVADGARGGGCRAEAPRCDMGLECGGTPASCRAQAAMGAECDFTGVTTFCATNTSCAPNAMATATTCQANGAAAGTACRTDSPRCDTGFECSTATGAGICQRLVAPMGACDTRYRSTVCTMGANCVPGMTAGAGVCTAPTTETEPNNTPMAANGPFTGSRFIRGAITPGTDVDCFNVTVPAMGRLRVETGDGAGGCPAGADTLLKVYNPMGTEIASDDDGGAGNCSLLDGPAALTGLAAGNYAVCVSAFGMMPAAIASYTLSVTVTP